jgi:hypothetical protein
MLRALLDSGLQPDSLAQTLKTSPCHCDPAAPVLAGVAHLLYVVCWLDVKMRAAGEQEVRRPDKPRPKPAPKASAETVPQAAKPAQSPMVPKTAAPQEQKGQGEGKPNRDRKAGKKNAATPAAGTSRQGPRGMVKQG